MYDLREGEECVIDGQTDRRTERWEDRWMEGRLDWMAKWMGRGKDGWINGQIGR